MRFVVEGIGKIGRAEILLDGITLIVGENNTGKSTIGKALFAHVNSVCGFSRRMKATYRNELSHILFYHAIMEYRDIIGFVHDLIDEMIDVLPGKELNPSSLARWIKHLVDGGGMSADDYETERVEKYLKWLSGRSRQAISFRGADLQAFRDRTRSMGTDVPVGRPECRIRQPAAIVTSGCIVAFDISGRQREAGRRRGIGRFVPR